VARGPKAGRVFEHPFNAFPSFRILRDGFPSRLKKWGFTVELIEEIRDAKLLKPYQVLEIDHRYSRMSSKQRDCLPTFSAENAERVGHGELTFTGRINNIRATQSRCMNSFAN
jgi:hypothetical protein